MPKGLQKARDLLNDRLKWLRYESILLYGALFVLVLHYFKMIGGATDWDEQFYFYVSSAVSRGAGMYADLHISYPPVLFFIGALLFKIFPDLYHAMLASRIFITALSLLGFYLIFDIFRKLKLAWFIIPAAIFAFYLLPLDLTVIKFRPDNLLYFILVLQGYLLFRLTFDDKSSTTDIFLIFFLFILSFHVVQKAIFIEPFLMAGFLLAHFERLKRFYVQNSRVLIVSAAIMVLIAVFSGVYHRFFYMSYIFIPSFMSNLPHFSVRASLDFLLLYVWINIAFWVTGIVSFAATIANIRKDRKMIVPAMMLAGTFLYLIVSIFALCPYIQYQLYCIWAILFSLPFLVDICRDAFPKRTFIVFLIACLLALSGYFTYGHFWWPTTPIKKYAEEIDRTRTVVGKEMVASLGASTIDIPNAMPYLDQQPGYRKDYPNFRDTLIKKAVPFIFIEQKEVFQGMLSIFPDDGHFIYANYQECQGLPGALMIASKWAYTDKGTTTFQIAIKGNYKILLLSKPGADASIDGRKLKNVQVMYLGTGDHIIISTQPAVVLMDHYSEKASSESMYDLSRSGYDLFPVDKVFSDKLELLGVLRYKRSGMYFYRFFWKALSNIDGQLDAFHHFRGSSDNFVSGINVDPGGRWYKISGLKPGEVFSYGFLADMDPNIRSMDIGWFYEQDWSKRVPYGTGTFFKLYL